MNQPALTRRLTQVLSHFFRQEAAELLSRLSPRTLIGDEPLDLSHWNVALMEATRPILLQAWQVGATEMNRKLPRRRKSLGSNFDWVNPRVLSAVDDLVLRFCRETHETLTTDLATATQKIREQMREGLSLGGAYAMLGRRIRHLFTEPYRAQRIAQTEGSRVLHAGGQRAARDSGVVFGMAWQASGDACEKICQRLDGREIEIGGVYAVFSKGGPYATIFHPPAHPWCFCSEIPLLHRPRTMRPLVF